MKTTKIILLQILLLFNIVLLYSQNSKYTLTVKEKNIIKVGNKYLIPVELRNISKDTLSHYEMSCSWQEHYSFREKDLKIKINDCDKNFPRIMKLKPNGFKEVFLEVNSISGKFPKKETKISFNLIKSDSENVPNYNVSKSKEHKNIVWSNKFKIQASR